MRLSPEQFADLAASFGPLNGAPARRERRRSPRTELEADLLIRPLRGGALGEPVAVRVRDFSSRGVALLHRAPLTPASQFIVQIERARGGCVVMLCTVMHCQRVQDELYQLGADFTCQLAEHPDKNAPADELESHLRQWRDAAPD